MTVLTVVFHTYSEEKFLKKLVSDLTSRKLSNIKFVILQNLQDLYKLSDEILLVGVGADSKSSAVYDFVVNAETTVEQALEKCVRKFQRKIDDQQQVLQEMQETIDEIK